MTRYRINTIASAATIELTEVGAEAPRLLEAFQDCAEGRCSCPTDEYEKVASMQVETDDDGIDIKLASKPGSEFDTSQIANCLDHTLATAESDRSTSAGMSETGAR